MRKKLLAKERIKEHSDMVFLEAESIKKMKGKWNKEVFKNNNPLFLELGMGKGAFLTSVAKMHPENNYLGLEIKEERALSAVKKAKELKLANFRILRCDFRLLPEIFKKGEIDDIYINFPDPWPKDRHAKRRMMHPDFLKMYKKVLNPKGSLQLKTDDPDFHQFSLESLKDENWTISENVADLEQQEASDSMEERFVMTEFEKKWRGRGKKIHFVQTNI